MVCQNPDCPCHKPTAKVSKLTATRPWRSSRFGKKSESEKLELEELRERTKEEESK